MNISILGVGYVGLVTGSCLSKYHNVICCDIDQTKIEALKNLDLPIHEENLLDIVTSSYDNKSISFTSSLEESIEDSEIIFLCVGTPECKDGSANLDYIFEAARNIASILINDILIVCKSTVPVGTCEKINDIIREELELRKKDIKFRVISNPEFLREGSAVYDFLNPDRVIIGLEEDPKAKETMENLYLDFVNDKKQIIFMPIRDAELTKYASNAMLATKISFMNEVSNICDLLGVDVMNVREGIGTDPRIGFNFINPGCGYGGSCFPKDVKALINSANEVNFNAKLLKAVDARNTTQKEYLSKKVIDYFGFKTHKTITVFGLAFKPDTDDMREASSVVIINQLIENGFTIKAHDPVAKLKAEKIFLKQSPFITFHDDQYEALQDSEALLLITEWDSYKEIDFNKAANQMNAKVIFDGRNIYNKAKLLSEGWLYFGIGR